MLENYNQMFDEMLDLMEFGLIKKNNGKFALKDYQYANLGGIESEEFDNAEQILDRMEIYEEDYIIRALEDFCDYDYSDWKDFVEHLKTTDLYTQNNGMWDIDVLDMICSHGKDIDLNKCLYELEEVC